MTEEQRVFYLDLAILTFVWIVVITTGYLALMLCVYVAGRVA